MVRFIGDIHGDINSYLAQIGDAEQSIQVGDFGIGFIHLTGGDMCTLLDTKKHRFIRGNHDNPEKCREYSGWIEDGTVEDNMMFVGGASSIDKQYRTENVNWWADEQLSAEQLAAASDTYLKSMPDIMVTHECPEFISDHICMQHNKTKFPDISRTRNEFSYMHYHHQPKLWLFGHWHCGFDKTIDGTRFICLDIGEYIDVDTITMEVKRPIRRW